MHSAIKVMTKFSKMLILELIQIIKLIRNLLMYICEKYLKENKVNEKEKESRASKPEEVITWLYHRCTLNHISSLLNS
jgi:hypothetical protein